MDKITIKEIAKITGLSTGTVSNVINNPKIVRENNRKKVLEAVNKFNYIPNKIAKSLSKKRTKNIGFIIPDIKNPYFPEIVRGAQDLLMKNQYYIFLCNTDNDSDKENSYIEDLLSMWVDGIILDSCSSYRNIEILNNIKKPIVLIDREIEGFNRDIVVVDNEVGAYKMTKYLIENGHKKILNINGPKDLSTARERYKGWERAMVEYGLEIRDDQVFWGGNSVEKGYEIMTGLLKNIDICNFDAIFASNDVTAVGVIECLKEKGFNVPSDISIAGFDDINFVKYIKPALTTYRNHVYKMGEVAASLLLEIINTTRFETTKKITINGEIIVRESVRKKIN
jgi:LacI family transcriptional regulator